MAKMKMSERGTLSKAKTVELPERGAPLSAEEERAWRLLVETGRGIREPIVKAREARRLEINRRYREIAEANGRKLPDVISGKFRDSMPVVPVQCRRWVVCRMAGISFGKSWDASGATWLEVQEAKARNEDFRCAVAAMEENCRQLMKAKAMSVVEMSQDEDAKVSLAQTNVSMKILATMDREHFSERYEAKPDEVRSDGGGGGFVINLVGDAAKAAEAAPEKKPSKALVYTDV